jgi:hypothetical protein
MHTAFLSESLRGSDHSEDLCVDGKIILEWILGKWVWKVSAGFIWLRFGDRWQVLVNLVLNFRVP